MGGNSFRDARPRHAARLVMLALVVMFSIASPIALAPSTALADTPVAPAVPVPSAPPGSTAPAPAPAAAPTVPVINACDTFGTLANYLGFTLKAMGPPDVVQLSIGGNAVQLTGNPVVEPAGWGLFIGGTVMTIFCGASAPPSTNPISICDVFSQLTTYAGYAAKAIEVTEGSAIIQLALDGGAIVLTGAEVASPVGWGLMAAPFVIQLACNGSSPPEALTPPTALSTPLPQGAVSMVICYPDFQTCTVPDGTTIATPDPTTAPSDPTVVTADEQVCYEGGGCESFDPTVICFLDIENCVPVISTIDVVASSPLFNIRRRDSPQRCPREEHKPAPP